MGKNMLFWGEIFIYYVEIVLQYSWALNSVGG